MRIASWMPVTVTGAKGCGTAVFMSLFYESLVRFTNSKENVGPGEMRMFLEPQSIKALGDVSTSLMSGRWPTDDQINDIAEMTMELGFRKRSFFGLFISKKFNVLKVRTGPISEKDDKVVRSSETYADLSSGDEVGHHTDLGAFSGTFQSILGTNVLVLLIDASTAKEMDPFHATVVQALIDHRRRKGPRDQMKTFHPIVFLTGSGPRPDGSKDSPPARDMMDEKCPKTLKLLESEPAKEARFQRPELFISWLRTERAEDGTQVPITVVEKGQVRPDYPYDEYARFIRTLGQIAKGQPDAVGAGKAHGR